MQRKGAELVTAASPNLHFPTFTLLFGVDVEYEALEYFPVLLGSILEESLPSSPRRALRARFKSCISERFGCVGDVEG